MTDEHTPGPWEFDGNCGGYVTQAGDRIARGYAHADARLIAAAPTILDALNAAQYYIGQLEAAQRSSPVRDLDEAQSAFIAANTEARAALNHDKP